MYSNYGLSKYIILIYLFVFNLSLGPVVWMYMAEILPDKGMAIATFYNWLFVLVVSLCFPMVSDPKVLDTHGVFFLFGFCCILGEIFMGKFVHETQGKT